MRWRWILGIAAGLFIVVIGAISVIVSRYDFNTLKPQITRAVHNATGRRLTVAGDINLQLGLTPTLRIDKVSFQNAPWGSQPEMAEIKHFELAIALLPLLTKTIELKRIRLVESEILIEINAAGKSNLEFSPPEQATSSAQAGGESDADTLVMPSLVVQELQIIQARFTYRDERSGQTQEVVLDRLTASIPSLQSPLQLELNGTYNTVRLEVTSQIPPLSVLTAQNTKGTTDTTWPLQLTAKAGGNTLSVDGTVTDVLARRDFSFNFDLQATDFETLEHLLGAPLTFQKPREPLSISGRVEHPEADTYTLSDLKIVLGPSTLSGSARVILGGARPQINAQLSSPRLDLRSFVSPLQEVAEKTHQPEARRDKVFPSDPLPLDALQQLDAAVTLRFKRLLLPRLAVNDLSVDLRLQDGHLTLEPVQAVVGGGTLNAHFALQPQGNTAVITTRLKLNNVDVMHMLQELEISTTVTGTLGVDIDLKGRGGSVAELLGSLNGYTSIVMGKGQLDSAYIDLLGGDLSASLLQLINPFQQGTSHTAVNCFVSRLDVKDGLADISTFVLDTSRVSVVGDGSINLKTEVLDVSLKPFPKEGSGISGVGKLTLSVGELTKAFKLGGTLARPALAIDTVGIALTVGKAAGGTILLGPVGIASSLLSSDGGDENRCLAALETAKTGRTRAPQQKQGVAQHTAEKITEGVKGLGRGLKKLLGR